MAEVPRRGDADERSIRSNPNPSVQPRRMALLEHALTELRMDTKMDQLGQEHPNVHDPSGNGEVEATVKQFQGILRTNKRDLEKRMGAKLPVEHPLFS